MYMCFILFLIHLFNKTTQNNIACSKNEFFAFWLIKYCLYAILLYEVNTFYFHIILQIMNTHIHIITMFKCICFLSTVYIYFFFLKKRKHKILLHAVRFLLCFLHFNIMLNNQYTYTYHNQHTFKYMFSFHHTYINILYI